MDGSHADPKVYTERTDRSRLRNKRLPILLSVVMAAEHAVRNVTLRYGKKNPLNFPPLLRSRDHRNTLSRHIIERAIFLSL